MNGFQLNIALYQANQQPAQEHTYTHKLSLSLSLTPRLVNTQLNEIIHYL